MTLASGADPAEVVPTARRARGRRSGVCLLLAMAACTESAPDSSRASPYARPVAVDGGAPAVAADRRPPRTGLPLPDGRDPLAPAWVQVLRQDALAWGVSERLLEDATDAVGELARGLLLCRVEALPGHTWDPGVGNVLSLGFARDEAPDMAVTLAVDDAAEVVRLGEGDHSVTHVAFPGVTLRAGARVRVRVFDRDVAEHDFMGEAHDVWAGRWPLTLRATTFTATCRPAPEGAVRRGAGDSLERFDREAAALERGLARAVSFSPAMVPEARFAAGRIALAGAAAWLGWSHPEVRARAARAEALSERAREALRDALTRVRSPGRDEPVSTAGAAISLRGTRCDLTEHGRPLGCAALLAVTPRTPQAGNGDLARVALYTARDAPWILSRCLASRDEGRTWSPGCAVRPGATALLAYGAADGPTEIPAPAVLEVQLFFAPQSVRFRLGR